MKTLFGRPIFTRIFHIQPRRESKYSLIDLTTDKSRIESCLIPISWRVKWNLCKTYRSQFSDKAYRRILKYAKSIKVFGSFYERVWQISDVDYVDEILAQRNLTAN